MATDTTLLQEIKERFTESEDASSEFREQFKRDMRFSYGDQWDDREMQKRKERGRPCLTFNRLNPSIRSITNDQRMNSPSPEVVPVDDQGDVKTAEVIQGMMRYILNHSNAKSAFSTAYDHSVRGGRGFFRILTEYEDPESFNQEIKIKRIINPLSVSFDPYSTEIDGSDAEYAFITDEMHKEKYKRLFGKSKLASFDSWSSAENPFVLNEKSIRIAEYFYKSYESKKLLLLSNGLAVFESDLDLDALNKLGLQVVEGKSRDVQVPSVKWCKTNGAEILEKTDWLGKWIPIIPVYGEEYYLDGKLHYRGMVSDAADPQKAFNALSSSEIEAIALAPKAPWLVTPDNIEGFKDIWDRSNENLPYLPFNPDASGFVPNRQSVEPAIAAITQAAMQAADNLKATTGIYDASLGAQSNEISGVGIRARTLQGQTANYHFQDNLNFSVSFCGRQCVDLIPKIYDAERAVRILGNEDEIQTVIVNAQNPDSDGRIYDLSAGKYDVRVQVGPSYLTKRQEAAAGMVELSRSNPQMSQFAGDLMFKALDLPYSQEIAERIRRTIPPEILGDENQSQIPPQFKAQMDQALQMVDAFKEQLAEAQKTIDEKRLELESKERIEFAKLETEMRIETAKLKAKEQIIPEGFNGLIQEIADINARLEMLGIERPINSPVLNSPGSPMGTAAGFEENQTMPTGGPSPGQHMEELNHE